MGSTVTVDADFASASASEIREIESGRFEICHKAVVLPAWFQETLDRLWNGGGGPKEYMFH